MTTFRLKNRNHKQADKVFNSGCKYFINKLDEIIEVSPDNFKLASIDWDLKDIETSELFEEAEQSVTGYNDRGEAITAWK